MKRTIHIEGMMCSGCTGRVEKALNALDGVSAKCDLANKLCVVELSAPVEDALLKQTVEDAGYDVTGIE